ncbi:MAG: family 43 glycosylhydrolase [Bacteroidota bacterium]
MKWILSLFLVFTFIVVFAQNQKPKVWIYTDMSDKSLPGKNHMGTINDPDDISAMAGYLLMCNQFDTKGIVVTSTHRNQHKDTPNQAAWANNFLGGAYRQDVVHLNNNIGGYPTNIEFIQSCIKESAERFQPDQAYASIDEYSTVKSLFDLAKKEAGVINVLCWGSLTEPAILVKHCLTNNQLDVLDRLRFIAHWTNSSWHQGTKEHPERVANCREDADACAYLKSVALNGKIKYYECGAIGQHGIVSGGPKGNGYFNQFKSSRLGKIFAEGKYVHDRVDHSDAATYWTLLGKFGLSLNDITSNGTNDPEIEKDNKKKFEDWSKKIHDELLRRSYAAVNSQKKADLEKALKQHKEAIHPLNVWMRDPIITMGPQGLYHLTFTEQQNETNSQGAPLWTSKDLINWEFQGYPYIIERDADNINAYLQKLKERNQKRNDQKAQHLRIWAPEYHYVDGQWVVMHTSNAGLGNLAISKGSKLNGEWNDWGAAFNRHHDPTLFINDDGQKYLVAKCTELIPLKNDLSGFSGEVISIGPSNRKMGHEGSFILKIEDQYVLFGTAWSTDQMRHGTYNLYYCTSDKLEGPYGPRKFAGRFLGHGTIFKDKEGRWWCTAFYNANRPTLNGKEASGMDLSDTAYTINEQGLTLVPMEIKMKKGELLIYPKDKAYRYPGKEEVQKFER